MPPKPPHDHSPSLCCPEQPWKGAGKGGLQRGKGTSYDQPAAGGRPAPTQLSCLLPVSFPWGPCKSPRQLLTVCPALSQAAGGPWPSAAPGTGQSNGHHRIWQMGKLRFKDRGTRELVGEGRGPITGPCPWAMETPHSHSLCLRPTALPREEELGTKVPGEPGHRGDRGRAPTTASPSPLLQGGC